MMITPCFYNCIFHKFIIKTIGYGKMSTELNYFFVNNVLTSL